MQAIPLGDTESKKKFHNVTWSNIYKPKKFGGLRFRDGCLWNKVSVGRFIWAIEFKQDSLWLKWTHSVYLKNGNFLGY